MKLILATLFSAQNFSALVSLHMVGEGDEVGTGGTTWIGVGVGVPGSAQSGGVVAGVII